MELVTGGAGFFGIHLTRRLLAEGRQVRVFDLAEMNAPELEFKGEFIQGDIRDADLVERAVRGCDGIYHNAAVLPISRSGKVFWEVNVQGTRNVLEAALRNNARKVVHISTSAVYGVPKAVPIDENTPLTPLGDYGRAKLAAEQVCNEFKQKGVDVSVVRPRTIVGSGRLGIFYLLFEWVRLGKRVYIIGGGDNLFQLVSASDLADACARMTKTPCYQEDFNIGAREYGTVRSDLEGLVRHAGTGSRICLIPAALAKSALRVLDRMHLSPLVDWHYKTADKPFYFGVSKTERLLDWEPRDSNIKMLTDAYDWYREHWREYAQMVGTSHRKRVREGVLRLLRALS